MDINKHGDPFDKLDWRVTRANQLIADGEKPDEYYGDDKYVLDAYLFMKGYAEAETQADVIDLSLTYPVQSAVWSIKNASNDRRFLLEAMSLCSDLPLDQQAKELGVDPEVVVTYEKFFYDIRERRDDPGFLLTRVLQPSLIGTLKDGNDPDFVWKFVAVDGGFEVVEACWRYHCRNPEKAMDFHRQAGDIAMYRNYGLAQYARPVNKFTAPELTEPLLRMVELQIKETAVVGSNHVKERAEVLKSMIEQAQFSVIEPDEEVDSADEPRFKDLLAAEMTGGN